MTGSCWHRTSSPHNGVSYGCAVYASSCLDNSFTVPRTGAHFLHQLLLIVVLYSPRALLDCVLAVLWMTLLQHLLTLLFLFLSLSHTILVSFCILFAYSVLSLDTAVVSVRKTNTFILVGHFFFFFFLLHSVSLHSIFFFFQFDMDHFFLVHFFLTLCGQYSLPLWVGYPGLKHFYYLVASFLGNSFAGTYFHLSLTKAQLCVADVASAGSVSLRFTQCLSFYQFKFPHGAYFAHHIPFHGYAHVAHHNFLQLTLSRRHFSCVHFTALSIFWTLASEAAAVCYTPVWRTTHLSLSRRPISRYFQFFLYDSTL